MRRRGILGAITAVSILLAMTACAAGDPLSPTSNGAGGSGHTIVIGSQDYYSNEIVAETYAQGLEASGYVVDRQFRIGQREAYLPELESGAIDLFPEYSGPLLQVWAPGTTARLAEDVFAKLKAAAPAGLRVLDQSPATDQDSYVVTQAFAEKWKLAKIEDLAGVTVAMTLGANSEAENRPNGPKGLEKAYGVKVGFTPIEDGGGPLTVKALNDGDIQLAIIYTADPSIAKNRFVSLQDTKGLFLASNLVPLASKNVDARATGIVNKISAAMSPEDLIALNARSVEEKLPASTIARDWLTAEGLIG